MDLTKPMSGIYLIRNVINNKVYVGSTGKSYGFETRWLRHRADLRGNCHQSPHLQNAWNKYGENNFEFMILEQCDDNMLIIREQHWIDYYDSMNQNKGYNLKEAGSRGKWSEESKKKMSESLKGRVFTEEHRRKLSEAGKHRVYTDEIRKNMSNAHKGKHCGKDNAFYGKHHTKETIAKQVEGRRLKWLQKQQPLLH